MELNQHGDSVWLENAPWFGCIAYNISGNTLTKNQSVQVSFSSTTTHITVLLDATGTPNSGNSGIKRVGVPAETIEPGASGIVNCCGAVGTCVILDNVNSTLAGSVGTWISPVPVVSDRDGKFRNGALQFSLGFHQGFVMEACTTSPQSVPVFLSLRRH